jgi:hypothetical protein
LLTGSAGPRGAPSSPREPSPRCSSRTATSASRHRTGAGWGSISDSSTGRRWGTWRACTRTSRSDRSPRLRTGNGTASVLRLGGIGRVTPSRSDRTISGGTGSWPPGSAGRRCSRGRDSAPASRHHDALQSGLGHGGGNGAHPRPRGRAESRDCLLLRSVPRRRGDHYPPGGERHQEIRQSVPSPGRAE